MGNGVIRRLAARLRVADDEEGSVLLLTIGYAVLALAVVLVCVDATSLHLEQKRLDAVADAAALAGADGFTLDVVDGSPVALLKDADVRAQARTLIEIAAPDVELIAAEAPDGVSARVSVGQVWHPPVFSLFVPRGVALTATATSRTVLG